MENKIEFQDFTYSADDVYKENPSEDKILNFLKELKYSFKDADKVFTRGSCFRLYCILKAFFPAAKPFYSNYDGHWITEINGKFWDINGEIDVEYVAAKEYEIITDEITLQSAYIPTWKGQSTSYSKYLKTI